MSDVLLTSLLEDKKSFFQVTLTRERLSWVRVTSRDGGGGGGGGGWSHAQRLKEREAILSASPSSVTTDVNSRRAVFMRQVLGVSTSDTASYSRWTKRKLKEQSSSNAETASAGSAASAATSAGAAASTGAVSGVPSNGTESTGAQSVPSNSYLNSNSHNSSPDIASHHTGELPRVYLQLTF